MMVRTPPRAKWGGSDPRTPPGNRLRQKDIQVRVSDLNELHTCLGRCIESEKRMIQSLTHFTRQLEDEKRITDEANNAVMLFIAGQQNAGG